jgi:hypothetical protein
MILNPADKPEERFSVMRGPNGNLHVAMTAKPHLQYSISAFLSADWASEENKTRLEAFLAHTH